VIKPDEAREIARGLLEAELPRRWAHTEGVAACARSLAPVLADEADLIEVAAWFHDIGYAEALALTGFHPLDGARFLKPVPGVPELVCQLVAHHTGAAVEAEERGMPGVDVEFRRPPSDLLDALTYCDLNTAVDGLPTTVDDRLAEIFVRYPAGHVVHRSIKRSAPLLKEAARNMELRIAQVGSVEVRR
jgi:hypothetical protein